MWYFKARYNPNLITHHQVEQFGRQDRTGKITAMTRIKRDRQRTELPQSFGDQAMIRISLDAAPSEIRTVRKRSRRPGVSVAMAALKGRADGRQCVEPVKSLSPPWAAGNVLSPHKALEQHDAMRKAARIPIGLPLLACILMAWHNTAPTILANFRSISNSEEKGTNQNQEYGIPRTVDRFHGNRRTSKAPNLSSVPAGLMGQEAERASDGAMFVHRITVAPGAQSILISAIFVAWFKLSEGFRGRSKRANNGWHDERRRRSKQRAKASFESTVSPRCRNTRQFDVGQKYATKPELSQIEGRYGTGAKAYGYHWLQRSTYSRQLPENVAKLWLWFQYIMTSDEKAESFEGRRMGRLCDGGQRVCQPSMPKDNALWMKCGHDQ
ncbi:hypothetical protein E6O75_ATG09094 [Venturia nashicola]|uniref:Uncharacterized protein n=1 Tax=Venturia nashicola TaxID=86259 RepID=A0A4Z1NP81_9PEZI|nr:hypothetical protein E6O75_ATG09094 [Venturia nashicola]